MNRSEEVRTQRFGAHVRRTAVGLIGMVTTFGAVLLLPLADATTLQFTVPIFGTLLSVLIVGEQFELYQGIALALVLGGIALAEYSGRKVSITAYVRESGRSHRV